MPLDICDFCIILNGQDHFYLIINNIQQHFTLSQMANLEHQNTVCRSSHSNYTGKSPNARELQGEVEGMRKCMDVDVTHNHIIMVSWFLIMQGSEETGDKCICGSTDAHSTH